MVRTRIAPSPTGDDIHIGNLYTALINYVWARKHNGQFIVRIEDTDRTRYVENAEKQILTSLSAFGLSPDEEPVAQSGRTELYQQYATQLVQEQKAYYSYVTSDQLAQFRSEIQQETKDTTEQRSLLKQRLRDPSVASFTQADHEKRSHDQSEVTVRLLVPEKQLISFEDEIRGTIEVSTDQIDDQVLLKSDGFPTYHLAVVVDDHLMEISHVIRAEDWISSTPKHVMLYDALGWERPVFAHLPLLRNPDKSKLSKRKNPVWAHWYLDQGYLPAAVLNYLALMGWSHPEEKEVFSIEELTAVFELKDVHAVGPVFDLQKLTWMNGMYIRTLTPDQLQEHLIAFYGEETYDQDLLKKTIPLIQERIKTLAEYAAYVQFFQKPPTAYAIDLSPYQSVMPVVQSRLAEQENWTADLIGQTLQQIAADHEVKPKHFFQMVRVVITGEKISPPLNESMEILGQDESVARFHYAVQSLEKALQS